jgi:hypothetical protein
MLLACFRRPSYAHGGTRLSRRLIGEWGGLLLPRMFSILDSRPKNSSFSRERRAQERSKY